ncbi:MAG UNVERIFIED_CONTAM: hypothetical protein LVR18_02940 [Planctomycetaceae bacterium]
MLPTGPAGQDVQRIAVIITAPDASGRFTSTLKLCEVRVSPGMPVTAAAVAAGRV